MRRVQYRREAQDGTGCARPALFDHERTTGHVVPLLRSLVRAALLAVDALDAATTAWTIIGRGRGMRYSEACS